jgi:hypothetical protein
MTTGQFLLLTEPKLANIWFEAWPSREEQFSRYMNIRSFEKLVLNDAKMAGFGPLQTIPEGGEVSFGQAIAPVSKDYNSVEEGLGYKITRKLQRKELYGQVAKFEGALRKSAADSLEIFAHAVLNNATATTISAGFDGLALASASHTRMDGGATQSNYLNADLTLANLQTARTTFAKYVDERGRPQRLEMSKLLVVPDLWPTAVELLDSQMRPDTANNAVNVVNRFGLDIMEGHYLSGTTFWAIFGTEHDVNFVWDFRPEVTSDEEFKTQNILRQVRQSYGRGHGEWRGFLLGNG